MFLIGNKVKPGLVGAHPDMGKLDMGNLVHTLDFRSVYSAVLDQWLGVKSREVLDGEFKAADVFAG